MTIQKSFNHWRKNHNLEKTKTAVQSGKSHVRHRPLQLYLELVTVCNLRCIMCAIVWDPRRIPGEGRVGYMNTSLIYNLQPLLPQVVSCIITGTGEPTIHPDFRDIVRFLKRFDCWICFNTNATLLNAEMAEDFLEFGVDSVTVSIDGATKKTFESIRQGSNYEKIISNVQGLMEIKKKSGKIRPHVDMEWIVMRENLMEMPMAVRLAHALGIGEINFEPLYDNVEDPNYHEFYLQHNVNTLPQEQIQEIFTQTKEEAHNLSVPIRSRFFLDPGRHNQEEKVGSYQARICTEPWTTMFIAWDGKVRTCCFNDLSIGDLQTTEFSSIWNGSSYQEFRQGFVLGQPPPSCSQCIKNGTPRHILPQILSILNRSER